MPDRHTLLLQSLLPPQSWPGLQPAQLVPPQSTSVSPPFFVKSLQVGALHVPPEHTRLWQSVGPEHPPPLPHVGHDPPPQSVPVSLPFLIESLHVAGWHVPLGQLKL